MARPKLTNESWHKLSNILRQINIYNKPNDAPLKRCYTAYDWAVHGVTYRPVLAIGLSPIAVLVYHQYRYWCKTGKWQKLMAIVTVDYV